MSLRTVLTLSLLLLTGSLYAEEKFGVEVYPGSTEDAALTVLSKESADKLQEGLPANNRIQFEQSVYTSADTFDQILAFYEGKFGMKAAAFNPENPAPLGPEGFALLQEIDMKEAVTSAKFFNAALDPAKFEGKVKLALFNKQSLPMVSIMDKGLNWKDGSIVNKSIVSITKQPELPKMEAAGAAQQEAPAEAGAQETAAATQQ